MRDENLHAKRKYVRSIIRKHAPGAKIKFDGPSGVTIQHIDYSEHKSLVTELLRSYRFMQSVYQGSVMTLHLSNVCEE